MTTLLCRYPTKLVLGIVVAYLFVGRSPTSPWPVAADAKVQGLQQQPDAKSVAAQDEFAKSLVLRAHKILADSSILVTGELAQLRPVRYKPTVGLRWELVLLAEKAGFASASVRGMGKLDLPLRDFVEKPMTFFLNLRGVPDGKYVLAAAEVTEPICERLQKKTALKREQILINSSHTHAGPQLGVKASSKGITGEDARTMEYTRQLQDKVVDVVVKALERMEPARLSWGGGVIDFAMNRREFTPNGVILGVNPRGLTDRGVPVLRVDGADGQPRAILFGTAVHGTTLGPDNMQLCGDFAGFAQVYLQEKYPKAQAMYMLGCAGDDNPYPRGTMELTRQHGQSLANEVGRVLGTKLRPIAGPLQIAFDRADLPLQSLSREQLQKIVSKKNHPQNFAATQMLAILDRGDKLPTHYTCPFTVWQFGQDLTLVGLPGEVVVDYVTLLEKALGPNQLWVAAYCNDVFGYLPSARVLSEGGYETRGLYSGSAGLFDAKAEGVVVEKIRELARRVGRKGVAGER